MSQQEIQPIPFENKAKETLPEVLRTRVLAYGTRMGGTFDFLDLLDKYLREHGIENPVLQTCRNVASIESAFFGDPPFTEDDKRLPKNIPAGVLVFPEMRRYDAGGGETVSTYEDWSTGWPKGMVPPRTSYFSKIEKLCNEHNVPIAHISRVDDPMVLQEQFAAILPPNS